MRCIGVDGKEESLKEAIEVRLHRRCKMEGR
jgi:hypothetical protein